MKLPESFVEDNLKLAKGASLFGVPIEDLTREELIAACVAGWKGQDKIREQYDRERNFLDDLDNVKSKSVLESFFGKDLLREIKK